MDVYNMPCMCLLSDQGRGRQVRGRDGKEELRHEEEEQVHSPDCSCTLLVEDCLYYPPRTLPG